MNIYPAVDILGGKAVRLVQGRKSDVTVYGTPMEMARRWAGCGAEWLHVVDLDGAFDGASRNHAVVAEIAAALPGLKIQLGGGIRDMSTLDRVFSSGVRRAVLGTSAVKDPAFAAEALRSWGERVAVGIDARDGIAKISGWTEDSNITALDLARRFEDHGAQAVIYTDISRDGVLTGPNVASLKDMLSGTQLRVIASGGIANVGDIHALAQLRHARLDGVIVGKALYEGLVDLKEVLSVYAG